MSSNQLFNAFETDFSISAIIELTIELLAHRHSLACTWKKASLESFLIAKQKTSIDQV